MGSVSFVVVKFNELESNMTLPTSREGGRGQIFIRHVVKLLRGVSFLLFLMISSG
jgi:hypothetical protein